MQGGRGATVLQVCQGLRPPPCTLAARLLLFPLELCSSPVERSAASEGGEAPAISLCAR